MEWIMLDALQDIYVFSKSGLDLDVCV